MGLIMSLTGVSLLDLAEIYETDIMAVSHLITTRCVGGLVGSLLGGKLFDRFNTQLMAILTVLMSMVSTFLIPLSGSIGLAHAVVFVGGMGLSALDTGANVWIMRLWPENSSPALQVFHLCFGVGSLIAPLIGEPFLSTTSTESDYELAFSNQTSNQIYPITQPAGNTSADVVGRESRIQYPFGMVSAFHLILLVSMTVLYFIDRSDFKPESTNETENKAQNGASQELRFSRTLVGLASVYICVYVAQECTLGQMLTAYAVKSDLHLPKSSAAHMAAIYFLCFTLSRVVAALVAIRVTSFQLLVVSHAILAVTSTVLLIWGTSSETVLWVCSSLLGVAQGPMYAAAVAWTVSYINMTNVMMSVIIIASGAGAMAPSLLVGQFLDSSPNAFLYVCFVTVVLCVIFLAVMYMYVRKRPMMRPEGAHRVASGSQSTDDVFSL